uniref:Reverse transcriptase domain-containing protein n=1 Tax=Cannabis sativa TaxID=3483 RepID=A0A803QF26_CANSA
MHFLKRKRNGKEGYMALKLDLSKAYDRVEWNFLREMMSRMGFHDRFVELIFATISTVRYMVVHDGKELGPICPERGIRQGDPLSPYLFLICAEGFSQLLNRFERNGDLKGCKVANGAPIISHLLFADDSYIYCRANEREASNVLRLLQIFELASGQSVNFSKSSVFFSTNISDAMRTRLCGILGMARANEHSTYLGLPCTMGRNKDAILGFLKDKMQQRIQSWEGKLLSKAGREILLKTVAQALPSYAMSVFLLPKKTCSYLEGLMSKYWWGSSSNNSNGITWMSWRRISRHKHTGGLGFRNLRDYNLSLLGKQGWRLLLNENSLVSRVYKARYFPRDSFLTASLGSNPSFIWRSIHESQDLVKAGARIRIADGTVTNVLNMPWLPSGDNPCVLSSHPALVNCKVHQLMKPGLREWDEELIYDIFNPRDSSIIVNIPLSMSIDGDRWYWNMEPSGVYSVKSSYHHIQCLKGDWSVQLESDLWKHLWKLKVPPKVVHFAWRALRGCLPTRSQLQTRHVPVESQCVFCNNDVETILHVLILCPFAQSCWNRSAIDLIPSAAGSFPDWFAEFWARQRTGAVEELLMVGWSIWKSRNELLWKNRSRSAAEVVSFAHSVLDQWISAQSSLDNGNNNRLPTSAKVNYKPYGIDLLSSPDPTGRFSNGQLLGFEKFIPPFSSASGDMILKGVNYASGAAGIRQESGQHLRLYSYGARKVALIGLGPIGCIPYAMKSFGAKNGSICVDEVNEAIQLFNQKLISLVDNFNNKFNDSAKFIYVNSFGIGSGDPTAAVRLVSILRLTSVGGEMASTESNADEMVAMEDNVELLRQQFLDEVSLELEADFEISAEVAQGGVLAKIFGARKLPKSRLLNLRDWPDDGHWQNVDMSKAIFWVEIHGLPTPYLAAQNSAVIGKKVGTFIDTDRASNVVIARRGFLKLKVEILINLQLPAGFFLSIDRGRREWIQFKYRKLPTFCFNCGLIGHERGGCGKQKVYAYPPVGEAVPLYGPWLKAMIPIRSCFDTRRPKFIREMDIPMSRRALEPEEASGDSGRRTTTLEGKDKHSGDVGGTKGTIRTPSTSSGEVHGNGTKESQKMPSVTKKMSPRISNSNKEHYDPLQVIENHPISKLGSNPHDSNVILSLMPNVGPTALQMVELPHEAICKSRTPHMHPEPIILPKPNSDKGERLVTKLLGSSIASGLPLDREAHSKKRKASGSVTPIVFDNNEKNEVGSLSGLADNLSFSVGKDDGMQGNKSSERKKRGSKRNSASGGSIRKSGGKIYTRSSLAQKDSSNGNDESMERDTVSGQHGMVIEINLDQNFHMGEEAALIKPPSTQ